MNGVGEWSDSEENAIETDLISDMRIRPSSWPPSSEILNINGTTKGCLEVTKGGILNTLLDGDCQVNRKPACEYKACLTVTGKKCKFPFIYKNATHPYLEYKICSGLDVYRPWCPTELDELGAIVEWGDCLDDCPSETINSACLTDPDFPIFSDGTDQSVNATTDFISGISAVTDEFDYVAFTCPEGYIFKESNNKTHYALCMNWEFIYLYNKDATCVRKLTNGYIFMM